MYKIVGYVTIFLGALWVLWPQLLRGWLVGRASWMAFWAIFFFLLYPYASWSRTWHLREWIAFCITLAVFGGLLRNVINAAAEKIPSVCYRAGGLLTALSGLFLVLFK